MCVYIYGVSPKMYFNKYYLYHYSKRVCTFWGIYIQDDPPRSLFDILVIFDFFFLYSFIFKALSSNGFKWEGLCFSSDFWWWSLVILLLK